MNKNQLKNSIEQITQAVKLINECEGFGYDHSGNATKIMIDQRSKMESKLYMMEFEERRTAKRLSALEREYSLLEADYTAFENKLSDKQAQGYIDEMEAVYFKIRAIRGEV